MVSCKLCKVTSGFRCPQKPELKKLWTDFLYLHLRNSVSVNNFFLCSFHFEEKCFDRTSAQKVVLRPHSVPTISYTYEERITNVVTFRGNETHHTEVCDAPSVEPQQNIEDELSNKVFEITKKLENLTTKTCANVLLKQQINNLKTLVSQQQCTIKTLKRRTSKQQRKICNLKDVVSSLRKKINYYENNSVDVNKFQENTELLSRMWAKINNKPLPNQYGPEIRKFAVTTHFYSPKAFSFIRKQFMDCLPHPKTLSVWYSSVNGAPGFTMFDEVAIKRCIEYDGQQYYGYADMGSIIEVNENEEAKEALVFMLVAINGSWKMPVGYFLSHSLNSEQKLGLLKQCLFLVKSVGIEISNITFDGCATNLSMASALGCSFSPSNLKTNFGEENILLLLDASHMMKLIRNTFGDKRKIVDGGV
ncbi:uncharacterized protein LOC135143250 [Zophobas morio]|uniref:uncharacterized protein LOC135143250 n=1 Tax=Zophobas morio TaxID=2755281 RepID=UPI003082ECF2